MLRTLREEDLLRLGVGTGHARKMVLRLPELLGESLPLHPAPARPVPLVAPRSALRPAAVRGPA